MPSIVFENVSPTKTFAGFNIDRLVNELGDLLGLTDRKAQVKLRTSNVTISRIVPDAIPVPEAKTIVRVDLKEKDADTYATVHGFIQAFLDAEGIGEDAEIYKSPKGDGEYSRGGKVTRFPAPSTPDLMEGEQDYFDGMSRKGD